MDENIIDLELVELCRQIGPYSADYIEHVYRWIKEENRLLTRKHIPAVVDCVAFLQSIVNRETPKVFNPRALFSFNKSPGFYGQLSYLNSVMRDAAASSGMWALVNDKWTGKLAKIFGDDKVLEVMSGAGWLAQALREHGTNIIATDDYSDGYTDHVTEVLEYDVVDAVKEFDFDWLLVSWPRGGIGEAIEWAGRETNIIHIGEPRFGCTGDDLLYEITRTVSNLGSVNHHFYTWPGINDMVEWRRFD